MASAFPSSSNPLSPISTLWSPRMTASQQNPPELVPVILERRNGRDELRFVPTCRGCGKFVLDISQANVAVVGGTGARPEPVGTYKGTKVFRLEGRAFLFCW